MSDNISVEDWESYLSGLYEWIQEKYALMVDETVDYSENEYLKDLEYYESEKERITKKVFIDQTHVSEGAGLKLDQSTFEQFFGVTIDENEPKGNPFEEVLEEIAEEEKNKEPEPKTIPSIPISPKPKRYETPKNIVINKELEETINKTLSGQTDDSRVIEKRLMSYESEETDLVDFSVFEKPSDSKSKTTYSNILLLGDSSSGRTSIRRAWMGRHFIESHLSTIGADMDKKQIEVDGKNHHVTLIDLGGQDFYKALRGNFYRKVDGAIIVFDITNRESFMRLDYWVKEYYRSIKELKPFVIVGNKADMAKLRKVKFKEGVRVSDNYSRYTMPKFKVKYLEVSAKDNSNVNDMFEMVLREVRAYQFSMQR